MRGRRLHRLLQVIALLRGPTSWNARRLAEHFGTSRRNIHRDLAVLELSGVPFWYDPDYGEGGGYRIRESFFFPHVGLTQQECYDLAVVTRLVEGQGIPAVEEVCHVRDKLFSTLPAQQQAVITEASALFDILSFPQADPGRCREVMRTLQQALLTKRQVKGLYQSPHEGQPVTGQPQPCQVFFANHVWYLAAQDCGDRQIKLYRLTRFQSLELLESSITGVPPFSLRDFLGNAWTVYRGERDYAVEVEFSPEAAPLVTECRWHHTQELEALAGGSLVFRATVSGLEEVKYWILGWGPRAVARQPKELAEEVRHLAQETARRYGSSRPR
ncbi:MAG: helix-turn-helix transcriptional regulator [Gemmataceae bacterium]